MKLLSILTALLLLAQPALAESDEITKAENILEMHNFNCGSGSTGWWLKLSSNTYTPSRSGGVSTSSGAYYGCGTCAECRVRLNQDIDKTLSSEKEYCKSRGGEAKVENRGNWTEDVQPTAWTLKSTGVGITCEKWIACK